MKDREIRIAFTEYAGIEELAPADASLCREAVKAMENSHSPYSQFRVGAALQLQSGKILHGSNQENVAYPSGLCAERVALFSWGANFRNDKIETLAITAFTDNFELVKPAAPCGGCLQVLAECEKKQKKPIRTLLYCINGPVWEAEGVETFLPFLFFEDRLITS